MREREHHPSAWTADELIAMARECIRRLPDGHEAKITREWVEAIRNAALVLVATVEDSSQRVFAEAEAAELTAIADALESYLPPEGV